VTSLPPHFSLLLDKSKMIRSTALLLALAVAGVALTSAFTINVRQGLNPSTTVLSMKFLKDLGFEKPSWLPDFGGGDKKEGEEKVNSDDAPKEEESKETSEPVAAKEK
jgi:hypothetical protein